MTAPQVTTYTGQIPLRTQEQPDFNNNVSDLLTWWPTSVPEMNTVSDFVNTQAVAAETSANLAQTVVSGANFKGNYSNLTGALNIPATVYYNDKYWQLLNNMADVTSEVPSVGATNWALAPQTAGRVVITPPITLDVGGNYYLIAAGDVTLPDPTTISNGVGFNFAKKFGISPSIKTIANGFSTVKGLTDEIVLNSLGIEFISLSGVYEV